MHRLYGTGRQVTFIWHATSLDRSCFRRACPHETYVFS